MARHVEGGVDGVACVLHPVVGTGATGPGTRAPCHRATEGRRLVHRPGNGPSSSGGGGGGDDRGGARLGGGGPNEGRRGEHNGGDEPWGGDTGPHPAPGGRDRELPG